MTGGTGQDAPDTDQALQATPRATQPIVLDDSDYAIPDEWGLKEAYNDEESVVHHGDTLYIAGTHSLRDVADDLLIPLHLVRNSQRYQQALAALQRANGRVKYLSGHSLGGAVAAVLQEDAIAGRLGPNYRGFREVRTYGAPLLHSDQIPNLHAYIAARGIPSPPSMAERPLPVRLLGIRIATRASTELLRCCRSPGKALDVQTSS